MAVPINLDKLKAKRNTKVLLQFFKSGIILPVCQKSVNYITIITG